jgi:hypothetical protein
MTFWLSAGVVGSGIIVFVVDIFLSQGAAGALATGIFAATLFAILWYTIETRKLRLEQALGNEIQHHPWLKASDLSVSYNDEGDSFMGRETVCLPITNVGATPAHDLRISVQWQVESEFEILGPNGSPKEIGDIDLAPRDTYHARLCEIDIEEPSARATIDVQISYRSYIGGGGQLAMSFCRQGGGGWVNQKMSPYQF